ncbi:MAG: hypothetical protein B7Y71_00885, partial [Xanthobacter sp. 35-67-6]
MFDLTSLLATTTEFIRANQAWAPAIVFVVAFGESVALVSFFIPATALLLAFGAPAGGAAAVRLEGASGAGSTKPGAWVGLVGPAKGSGVLCARAPPA